MKSIKQRNPIVLALAIIGIGVMVYLVSSIYQHYAVEQQRAILLGPASGAVGQALRATPLPPPQ